MIFRKGLFCLAVAFAGGGLWAGTSCRDGVASAVPLPGGRAPVIDGKLDDWDRSGAVLCWNAEERADRENATLYFMYDATNLYLACEMRFDGRGPRNESRPQDRYWFGDLVQLRLSTDRTLPYPLPQKGRKGASPRYDGNDRVTCINLWRNTADGSDNLYVTPGAHFDCPPTSHPSGSAVKSVAHGQALTLEARIPWRALGVADGTCPFAPGEMMTAIADVKWAGEVENEPHAGVAIYNADPGVFAFLNVQTWGRLAFAAKGNLPPPKDTYAVVAAAARAKRAVNTAGWAEIAFDLPKRAKVSVNVLDEKGGVIRELMGGEPHEAGRVVAHWDGRDALGFPCATGRAYRWGAYAHDGLDVTYFGTVGTSGEPPYDTPDRTGGWGGDHGPLVDATCDGTGRYFVWHMNESGRGIVKTDFAGRVVWRTMPFAVDGWGNYSCFTADSGYLYLVYENRLDPKKAPVVRLVRVNAATGNYEPWPSGEGALPIEIAPEAPALPPGCAIRPQYAFDCVGIAAQGGELFISDFSGNRLLVHSAETGRKLREISVRGPRGLWLHGGALYAATVPGAVVKVDPATGATETIVSGGLAAPHGIALDAAGRIYVSDLGDSQQVKVFADGRLVKALGKKGGRGFLGRIDFGAYQYPFGLAVDRTGTLLVTEAAAPKIASLVDTSTFETTRRYFGYTAYSPSNVPDPDDPLVQYYSLEGPDCFARARLPPSGGTGEPDAVWDFESAGVDEFGCVMNTMTMPDVVKATNGRKYLTPDSTPANRRPQMPMTVCLVAGDEMRPVAGLFRVPDDRYALELWMDANGDGRVQADEKARVAEVAGRRFTFAAQPGSFRMEADGTAYVLTQENVVLEVPCRGFSDSGVPQWNAQAVRIAIPEIIPGLKKLYCGWRQGLLGLRRDSAGNFYAAVSCSPAYATKEYTAYMRRGMGHTADVGAVYLTKYAPDGRLLWKVGRKAVGGMRNGEMLHHWCFAGLIGDDYAVAASEWGVFTVYTKDGFYVDRLFDVPGVAGRGIPYSFGGEDFSGRIQHYPARDEVWAFNSGRTFRVSGFERGRVKGEWRTAGEVRLERVQPLAFPGAPQKALSDVSLEAKADRLVFKAHVADGTPLVNVATDGNAVFKGGDAVGFELGPAAQPAELPERNAGTRRIGYARLLAARLGGRDRVIAFKPFTDGERRPQAYTTPAGGTAAFEWCGEVPGATVAFAVDADGKGYSVEMTVPKGFFELDFARDVWYDAEALFSGEGGRGLQTVRREYLFNPETSATTMVDDVPTEARLRPVGWRKLADRTCRFVLDAAARVTVVVEDAEGRRVRNLLADEPLAAGPAAVEWDGRDDNGAPLPPGDYRWRGLAHAQEITANWTGSFYSPGSTPWKQFSRPRGWNVRESGAGGWLSDHVAPWSVFADDRHVYLGCKTAEAGDAIIQCDLDGNKIWGNQWLGLSGAHAMCTESNVLYVASEGGWLGGRLAVNRYNIRDYAWVPNPKEVRKRRSQQDSAFILEQTNDFHGVMGLYLTPRHVVIALSDKRRLAFFDRETARWDHDEPLANLRSLVRRPNAKVRHGFATDADGNLYVCATNAAEQCVKVYSPTGAFLRCIGKPGGRREGRYDPEAMGNPVDVAVDARGFVWVCENSFCPKRVSVWTREGRLVREYVGTPFYGGGGSLSPDGQYAFYSGMRFRLKPGLVGGELEAVLFMPDEHPGLPGFGPSREMGAAAPDEYRSFRGRPFLVQDDGACLRRTFIGEIVGDRLVPRVVCGREQKGVFLWQDGQMTRSEAFSYGAEWALRLGPNMELLLMTADRKAFALLAPDENLRYDFGRAETIPLPAEFVGVCSVAPTPDGRAFIVNRGGHGRQGATENVFGAMSREGRVLWTYPNPYPTNGHNSPLPRRGELRHTLGIEGFSAAADGLMLLNGNKGTRYLFTTDGLFVQELFGDMRTTKPLQSLTVARRGEVLSRHSLQDECFGGWMGDVNGKPHVIEGKDSLNICELRGTESVRRLKGGALRVTEPAPPLVEVPLSARGPARTLKAGGFGLSARDWWKATEYAFPERDPVARFSMGWSGWWLTLHYDVTDATPFENHGEAPHTLFHTGDAVDFRWEGDPSADPRRREPVAGDQRLVVVPLGDRIVVMRYVFVDPAAKDAPVEFVSPAGRTTCARVEEVTEAKVSLKRRKDGYALRVDIPWTALGEPRGDFRGGLRRADAGVIFGDDSGTRVLRRQYLFDPGSQEVSDIPSEARVNPSAWGTWEF